MKVCNGDIEVSSEVFVFMSENKEFSWVLDIISKAQKIEAVRSVPVQHWCLHARSQKIACTDDKGGRLIYQQDVVFELDQRLTFFYIDNKVISFHERFPKPAPLPQTPKKKKIKKGKMGYKEGVFRSM